MYLNLAATYKQYCWFYFLWQWKIVSCYLLYESLLYYWIQIPCLPLVFFSLNETSQVPLICPHNRVYSQFSALNFLLNLYYLTISVWKCSAQNHLYSIWKEGCSDGPQNCVSRCLTMCFFFSLLAMTAKSFSDVVPQAILKRIGKSYFVHLHIKSQCFQMVKFQRSNANKKFPFGYQGKL